MYCSDCEKETEIEEIFDIVTEPEFVEDENKWAIVLGFSEKCKYCHSPFGDGWGDPWFYKTKEEADEVYQKLLKRIGECGTLEEILEGINW